MRRIVSLGEAIELNPSVKLPKGQRTRFVSMDRLQPFTKQITGCEERVFSGGSKFQNNDTLLARITPCLENGKTAFVDFLETDEIAAGSTEFLVLRAKLNITDPQFVFYLSISPEFRKYAIQSMVGTSGRQRVQNDSLAKFELELPDLIDQRRIGQFLCWLDEKIGINRKLNKTLEQMGQALFRHYFISSPEVEQWEEIKIGELVNIKGGGTPSTKNPDFWDGSIAWTSPRDLTGRDEPFLLATGKTITNAGLAKISSGLLPEGTLLLSSRAPIGYVAIAAMPLAINQGYIAFLPSGALSNFYMYFWLKQNMDRVKGSANGSTFMEISKSAFRNITTRRPANAALNDFNAVVAPLFDEFRNNQEEIRTLTTLRDSILPRLIVGKVKI